MESAKSAQYWHKIKNDRIQCDLCPRYCKLKEGKRGFCFVRKNEKHSMVLSTYGLSSGFCVDPIEKKPLNHFYPGSAILSFGTAGCNLGCKFCQNWHISRSKQTQSLSQRASPEKIAGKALKLNCKSVAFTYNDPIIFLEYAVDTAKECREKGIKTVAVTAGYINPEPSIDFFSHMDSANVDLKSFQESFYKKFCNAHLEPVLDTLIYIKKHTETWLEITTLLIPGLNDSEKELSDLSNWIVKNLGQEVPLHLSAFHPDGEMTSIPRTSLDTLNKARNIARQNGIFHVYTGNVSDPSTSSTYCHHCQNLLIERDWYSLGKYNLTGDGLCKFCKKKCAGHFDGLPGSWGTKRLPVQMNF